MNKKSLLLRVDEETRENLNQEAEKRGISSNRLMQESLQFYLGFETDCITMVRNFARDIEITPANLVEPAALEYLADVQADYEYQHDTCGEYHRVFIEFAPGLKAREFFEAAVKDKLNQRRGNVS